MAQLYKMTLYVCDLEESLSLDEIETLIEQDAMDGIAVNCICHFADRHIGKQVEWDDDIDLNRCDCPTSAWDKYFTSPTKPMTNADRIRVMSNEHLANYLIQLTDLDCRIGLCQNKPKCEALLETEDGIPLSMCEKCLLEWLQQPAEEV